MPKLDLKAQDADAMETWHDQTRYYRSAMGRRARIIDTYMRDPQTIRRAAAGRPRFAADRTINLPDDLTAEVDFTRVCAQRGSTPRTELAGELCLSTLSALLKIALAGNRRKASPYAEDAIYTLRPYPSAGGLYPCEIYVIPGDVKDLDCRPYSYDPLHHALIDRGYDIGSFSGVEMERNLPSPPCAVVIAASLERSTQKYGPRGYRFACLEAGHIGQALILAATALGASSLVYGSFYENELENWLGLDGRNEVVVSVVLIGQKRQKDLADPLEI